MRATGTPRQHPTTPDKAEEWRSLALRAFAALDAALEADNSERDDVLAEACAQIEARIDDLDSEVAA